MKSATVFFTQIPYEGHVFQVRGVVDEQRHLEELSVISIEQTSILGRIYRGRVMEVVPSIGAAFVRIDGDDTKVFLPFDDCLHIPKPEEELLIQINKEAMKTKAPRGTQFFELTSRHCCLVHGAGNHGVSKKLSADVRKQWKSFLEGYDHTSYHLLLRTGVTACKEDEIASEIAELQKTYEAVLKRGETATCYSLVYDKPMDEVAVLGSYLQRYASYMESDQLRFVTDDKERYEAFLSANTKEGLGIPAEAIQFYQDASYELYKLYSLSTQMEELLQPKVYLKSGGDILIESMETLTAIDVNSGKGSGKGRTSDQVMAWNKEAAVEIARQLRLRNISGMILIDFINMDSEEAKQELLHFMKQEVQKDTYRVTVVDITALGLMEITREKVAKPLKQTLKMC